MYYYIMINLLGKHIFLNIVNFVTKDTGEIIDFLQPENKILRSKIDGRVFMTEYDRRLLQKCDIKS